ncbi:MAG TPA: polysaccharide biosynthesis tyrosine autokinase, partial [Thermopetrobacter sp.]|nr:polysaccharide biosynthesis tyrosine autokinase [Thermopetrobacter sp.]
TIPAADARRGLRLIYRSKRAPKGLLPEVGESGNGEAEAVPVELTVWKRKPTLMAESFRAALTSILFSGQNGDQPRVVTLTSPGPQEGKTTVASNLAVALAEINRKVLLIDADLRKPRQHQIFNVSKDHGLAEILLERGPLSEESLNGSIRATEVENLYLLPAGEQTLGSTNLLYSSRMAELLERLDEAFDMILIDTPPMMQIPDARILGRLSDAVILVLRAGQTTRDTALAARERLAADGTRVLGTILNYWDPKKSSGGYYHYYYDRYYRTRYYHEDV